MNYHYSFYCISYQINAALVSIRNFFKKNLHWNYSNLNATWKYENSEA